MTAPSTPAAPQVTAPRTTAPSLGGRLRTSLVRGWPVVVPALVALVTTAWRYDTKPLWRDEVYTLVTAGRPLPDMVTLLSERDGGLSVYYLLMHAWLGAGTSDWWMRLPSPVATVAAAALTAAVARRVRGDAVALLAGLLVVLAPAAAIHAQEARPYPLVLAAVAGTALLALGSAEMPRQGRWTGLSVVGALAVGLHPLVALPAVAGIFAGLWLRPGRALRRHVVAAGAPAAAVGLALVAVGFSQAAPGSPESFDTARLLTFWKLFGDTPWPGLVVAALAAVGLASLGRRTGRRRREALVLGTWALLPIGAVCYLGLSGSYFNARYATASAPAVAVLAAVGVVAVGSRAARGRPAPHRGAPVAAGVAVALAVVALGPGLAAVRERGYDFDDAPTAAAQLAAQARPGDAVVYPGSVSRPLVTRYEWPAAREERRPADVLLVAGPLDSDTRNGLQVPSRAAGGVLEPYARVWVVGTMAVATDDLSRRTASTRAAMDGRSMVSRTDHGHVRVELWERPGG